jgi:hypothetical protein
LLLVAAALGVAVGFFLLDHLQTSTDFDLLSYTIGVVVEALAIYLTTRALASAEPNDATWLQIHARHSWLLYLAAVGLTLLWPGAGHGSSVVLYVAVLAWTAVLTNGAVILVTRPRGRGVAA